MSHDDNGSLKGNFLIAMPSLMDPNFAQTVTVICEHSAAGAVGVVINREHQPLSGKDIFEELKIEHTPEAAQLPIHIGGPVHLGEVFILHGPPFAWQGCLQVTATLALSNTRDILEAIAKGQGPKLSMILLGCAGWGEGQLEGEIKQNAWLSCPVSDRVIYEVPVTQRWEAALQVLGIDPSLLSGSAGHA